MLSKYFSAFLKGFFVLAFYFAVTLQFLFSQSTPTPEYQLKAVFLFNFTRFIDWPSDAYSSHDAPFIIGILGDDPFGFYIDEMIKDEKNGSHPILVQRFAHVRDIRDCHILYIHPDEVSKIKNMLPALHHRNILTVSDAPDFTKWGGMVRFLKEERKVRLQINLTSTRRGQLQISSKLLSLANIVN